jgi:hypothetical protein
MPTNHYVVYDTRFALGDLLVQVGYLFLAWSVAYTGLAI